MASSETVLSEIMAQKQMVDPFKQAKVVSQSSVSDGVASNDPWSMNPIMPQQTNDPNTQQQQKMDSIYNPIGQQLTMPEDLFNKMKSLDINTKGISLSNNGKELFNARMRGRWGDNWNKNPDHQKVMDHFDKTLSFYDKDAATNQVNSLNNANRTLAALKGAI